MACPIGKHVAFSAAVSRAMGFEFPPAVRSHMHFNDYVTFMALKTIERDFDVTKLKLAPGPDVDEVWHAHIMVPGSYVRFCELMAGKNRRGVRIIEHDPSTERDPHLATRENATVALYESVVGGPCDWFGSPILTIETLDDSGNKSSGTITVPYDPKMTILKIKQLYMDATGVPKWRQNFVYAGNLLRDHNTISSCKIRRSSKLTQVVRHFDYPVVIIQTSAGSEIAVKFNPEFTVERIKELYQNQQGIPPENQRLIFAGKQLDDNLTLADYNILKEDVLHLCLNCRGC